MLPAMTFLAALAIPGEVDVLVLGGTAKGVAAACAAGNLSAHAKAVLASSTR